MDPTAALCLSCTRSPAALTQHEIFVRGQAAEGGRDLEVATPPNTAAPPARRPSFSAQVGPNGRQEAYTQVPTAEAAAGYPARTPPFLGFGMPPQQAPNTSRTSSTPSVMEAPEPPPKRSGLQAAGVAALFAFALVALGASTWLGAQRWWPHKDVAPARKAREAAPAQVGIPPISLSLPGLHSNSSAADATAALPAQVVSTIANRLGQLGIEPHKPAEAKYTAVARHQHPGNSLFCFALMLPWSNEQMLLQMQYRHNISIFLCDEAAIYSNTDIEVAPGKLRTNVVNIDLNCDHGGEFGTALNTDIFMAVWRKVMTDGRYLAHDWTVKADPDAVFLPDRLRTLTAGTMDTPDGVYFNNCKFGLHGPLEVFSRNAVRTLEKGIPTCTQHFNTVCSGPCKWGEDMFVDQCLEKVLHVRRVNEYSLLLEAHCDPPVGWQSCEDKRVVSFHPFKAMENYMECMRNTGVDLGGDAPAPTTAAAPMADAGAEVQQE